MSVFIEAGFSGQAYDLNHPRLCWNSIARRATVTASTEEAGFEAINAASPFTYSAWKPTAVVATYDMVLPAPEAISYVAFSSHTFGTSGCTIQIQRPNGSGGWINTGPSIQPDNDEDIVVLLSSRDLASLRIRMTGAVGSVAVIAAGDVIELPQMVYAGAPTPIHLARVTEFDTNRTVNGQWVGRTVKRRKNENEFKLEHVTEAWVNTVLDPFIENVQEYPYFLVEQPAKHPQALSYRWRDEPIVPRRMGIRDYMEVDL